MKVIHALLDYSTPWALPDVFLFTGNPIRNSRGEVVMGRGAAKQVRDCYPTVAKQITTDQPVTLLRIDDNRLQYIGWFQVKHHWREPADRALIKASAECLAEIAKTHPETRFHLNAPGVGNGRLKWADVEPLLRCLPDNVMIYLSDVPET